MTRSLLSPEGQLVLLSAGGPENHAALRALLERPIDWRRVKLLATLERAVPVLWRRLQALRPLPEVEPGIELLEASARVWEFKLLRQEQLLRQLLDVFANEDIRVVLLKGSGLALTVYRSFVRRPMSDLDLLVSDAQAEKAWRLARQVGFRWDAARYPMSAYDRHHHFPPLQDAAGTGAVLDLHTQVLADGAVGGLTAEVIWRDAVPVDARGLVLTPSRSHQVLHSCLHFSWAHRSRDKTWRTFRDIWAYCECDDIDWNAIGGLARSRSAASSCYWTFRLARDVAGVRVPGEVLAACRVPWPEAVRSQLQRHLTLGLLPFEDACPSSSLERWIWSLCFLRRPLADTVDRPVWQTEVSQDGRTSSGSPARRLARHLGNREAWWRYGRALLAIPRSGA